MNAWLRWSLILLIALALAGCKDEEELPADHTVDKGGAKHAPNLFEPEQNCTGCHGSSLQGGEGPSCYSCHGKKW